VCSEIETVTLLLQILVKSCVGLAVFFFGHNDDGHHDEI